MCGPLVLAMPLRALPPEIRWAAIAFYHTGRIAVYAAGGLLLGLAGHRIYLAGHQQAMSVTLGSVILAQVLVRRFSGQGWMPDWLAACYRAVHRLIHRWWTSPGLPKFLLLGIGNGLLPCSMVYLALAGALTRDGAINAMAFMGMFGMGTLPLLLGVQFAGRASGIAKRQHFRQLMPFFTAIVGILLIFRGLNLGIPLISPVLAHPPGTPVSCH